MNLGRAEILEMVRSVKKWVKKEGIEVEVKLVKARDNKLADALSRFAKSNRSEYHDERSRSTGEGGRGIGQDGKEIGRGDRGM